MSEAKQILDTLINDFSIDKFNRFFREKSRQFKSLEENYSRYNDDNFKNGLKLGEINFDNNDNLTICAFEVKKELSERAGKKAQYQKAKDILKSSENQKFSAGIFIFYDLIGNFRFSLVYPIYSSTKKDWSTFRRFTYLVSSVVEITNKTFKQRIGDGDFSSLEKVKDAFSVEKVTKEFYSDIANWYFWAVENSNYPQDTENEKNGRNIAIIRLITRLIFIWFMKERGLIPSVLFNQSYITNLLKNLISNQTTYYKAILQNLFFATLNTKIKDRKYRFEKSVHGLNRNYMDHSIYRYENYFTDKEKALRLFKDIPFLNGGLFDCLDKPSKDNNNQGEIRIDGFTDKEVGLKIPNFLFFSDLVEADLNAEYGTQNKKYHVRGLLNILSAYNFTIDENDPNDQEIALDPELLGKVFENLLASFNPETASTARKTTGSYYTPREIVDYMVIESLKGYLKTNMEEVIELDHKLEILFSSEDQTNPFNKIETEKIVFLINDLRVVDPAVGSGAFPMGILNKLVYVLSKLDPNNILWKETQINAVEKSVSDPMLKRQLIEQIEERFENKNFNYGRKLYLIQKCIYGVDLQQIAVEIAKLRFFISLLVDEKIDKNKENWGIEPLPNLDYKIMQGNSLLEEYEGIKLFDEKLLNIKLPDKNKISEVENDIKIIEKKLLTYYIENPKWMKSLKIERPQELVLLESEINRLKLTRKDLLKYNLSNIESGGNLQALFSIENEQSKKVWSQLQDLHKQLFTPMLNRDEKHSIKSKINKLEWELIEETLKEQGKLKELEKIEKLENSNTKPFFLWHLYFPEVFEEKGGFDIVIANPPYISAWSMEKDDPNSREEIKSALFDYTILTGHWDMYIAFVAKGHQLLRNNGILSYIVPNPILREKYAKETRKFLLIQMYITSILEFNDTNVFDGVARRTTVLVAKKDENKSNYKINIHSNKNRNIIGLIKNIERDSLFRHPNHSFLIDGSDEKDNLVLKIENQSGKIGNFFYVNYGAQVSSKIKGKFGKKAVVGITPIGNSKHFYEGKDVHRWTLDDRDLYLDYRQKDIYGPRVPELFEQDKIVFRKVSDKNHKIAATLDTTKWYTDDGNIILVPRKSVKDTGLQSDFGNYPEFNSDLNLKYVLAVMLSVVESFYFIRRFATESLQGSTSHTYPTSVRGLPIKNIVLKNQKPFIQIVDKILDITKSIDYLENSAKKDEVKQYEKQIDQMVYRLYGLTEDEIKIVEGENES